MLLNESEMYAQVSNLIVFKRFPGSADLPNKRKVMILVAGIQLSFQVLFSVSKRFQNRQTSTEFEL